MLAWGSARKFNSPGTHYSLCPVSSMLSAACAIVHTGVTVNRSARARDAAGYCFGL